MRPIFANSAHLTVPERLVLRGGSWRPVQLGVRYGAWVHPVHGPVLIDTGYGPEVTMGRRSLAMQAYAAAIRPVLAEQPETVLARLGFSADDVRYVFITHFHADHISGLKRFPNARFIAAGWPEVKRQSRFQQLRHGIFAELLPADFEARLIPMTHDVFSDGSMLSLDLPGHALGHTGVVWPEHKLVYAADAQWLSRAVTEDRPPQGPARLVYHNETAMQASLDTLRGMSGYEFVFCHDPAV